MGLHEPTSHVFIGFKTTNMQDSSKEIRKNIARKIRLLKWAICAIPTAKIAISFRPDIRPA